MATRVAYHFALPIQMFKKGREGDAPSNYRPTVGEACVACCHSDKKWYRVRVDTVQEDELTVSNLDLGKVENVSVSDVQPLPVELKELPLQVIDQSGHPIQYLNAVQ